MFPYRRQSGAKKRVHSGPVRGKGRGGGANRPLPNSARELLPLFQPTTKALAQVLAGRSRASGQLNQARNLLAQAERLVAERGHNRLNPMEREEFFEQLARLKLTLAAADAEAATEAQEEQEPERPAAPPVGRDRLREMAMSLVTQGPGADRLGAPRAPLPPAPVAVTPPPPERLAAGEGMATTTAVGPVVRTTTAAGASRARGSRAAGRSERLVLETSRVPAPATPAVEATVGGEALDRAPADEPADGAASHVAPASGVPASGTPVTETRASEIPARVAPARVAPTTGANDGQPPAAPGAVVAGPDAGATNGHASGPADPQGDATTTVKRRGRKTQQGLPEGWVIDDEGFVVPGSR